METLVLLIKLGTVLSGLFIVAGVIVGIFIKNPLQKDFYKALISELKDAVQITIDAKDEDSPGGKEITRGELDGISKEVLDIVWIIIEKQRAKENGKA